MLGAIAGDIFGPSYEFDRTKDPDIDLFFRPHFFTDDTVLTIVFLDADDFAHTLRLVISVGGDAAIQGAIAGAVAEAHWGGAAARHRDRSPPVPAVAHDGRRRPVHGELLRSMTKPATRNHDPNDSSRL